MVIISRQLSLINYNRGLWLSRLVGFYYDFLSFWLLDQ